MFWKESAKESGVVLPLALPISLGRVSTVVEVQDSSRTRRKRCKILSARVTAHSHSAPATRQGNPNVNHCFHVLSVSFFSTLVLERLNLEKRGGSHHTQQCRRLGLIRSGRHIICNWQPRQLLLDCWLAVRSWGCKRQSKSIVFLISRARS